MASPVLPSEFCDQVAPSTASLCYRFKFLLLTLPQMLCDLTSYMFDEEGEPTEEFVRDLAEAGAFFSAGDTKYTYNPSPQIGWLDCDGGEVSRATYPELHVVLRDLAGSNSYIFGDGDGSTTFNLPDHRGRCIIGSTDSRPSPLPSGISTRVTGVTVGVEDVTLTALESGLQQHSHTIYDSSIAPAGAIGLRAATAERGAADTDCVGMGSTAHDPGGVSPRASVESFPVDAEPAAESHENMQPSIAMRTLIYTGRIVS